MERAALTISLIAFVAACLGIVLRMDCSLFAERPRFSLRTLLIVLALGPPLLASGYLTWHARRQPRPHFLTEEDFPEFIPPPDFKLSRKVVVRKRIEADAAARRFPLPNNRP